MLWGGGAPIPSWTLRNVSGSDTKKEGGGGEFRSLHRLSYCPFSATASDAELAAPALNNIVLGGADRGRRETGHWRGRSRGGGPGTPGALWRACRGGRLREVMSRGVVLGRQGRSSPSVWRVLMAVLVNWMGWVPPVAGREVRGVRYV